MKMREFLSIFRMKMSNCWEFLDMLGMQIFTDLLQYLQMRFGISRNLHLTRKTSVVHFS